MATIPITGIPSSFRYPGPYAEIVFGQGPSTAGAGVREVVFVMPMTSSGTWTVNTLNEVKRESDASTGAGPGSEAHRAVRAALAANKNARYWVVPYAASSGGSPATATSDITFTTTPTGTGVAQVWMCGEECSYAYDSSDTVTTVAAGIKDAINAKTWLPVFAANTNGVLTVSAKIAGASQGNGTIGKYQWRAKVSAGTGITVSAAAGEIGSTVVGADGTTTEAANLLTALAVLNTVRKYYIGVSLSDATSLGHLKTHIVSKSEPNPGMRSVGIGAYPHTLAGVQTIATGLNYERIRLGWQIDGDDDPATVVGNMAAVFQLEEGVDSASGFDLYRKPGRWNVKAAYDTADWMDIDDCNDAINDGIIPIRSDASGSFMVMSVTTRSKNAAGTQDDFRAAESHRISVPDEFTDVLIIRDSNTFANKKLQSDKLLPSGAVDPNQILPSNTTTPYNYRRWFIGEVDQFAPGKFQELEAMKESLDVRRDPANTGRLEVGFSMRVVDIRHQVTFSLSEVSPG